MRSLGLSWHELGEPLSPIAPTNTLTDLSQEVAQDQRERAIGDAMRWRARSKRLIRKVLLNQENQEATCRGSFA